MTREELDFIGSMNMCDEISNEAYKKIMCHCEVEEQQPSEDCISRAKALEMLGDEPENWTDTEKEIQEVNDYRWFKSILEELPAVTQKQSIKDWLSTFNTESATECFTAVQRLKERVNE